MGIALLAFSAVSVLLQAWGGAYVSEFAGYPDEPVHYVTGLMVRDYLATFPWRAPMPFAEEFYRHYPTVGIGHWPPVFYAVQGVWTLIFGASRTAILLLMALSSAATATVLFHLSRPRLGSVAAGALGMAFLSTPLVQEFSRMVMAEMLMALFILLAAVAYQRYLETTRSARRAAIRTLFCGGDPDQSEWSGTCAAAHLCRARRAPLRAGDPLLVLDPCDRCE